MKKKKISFAQKGLILDSTRSKILVNKYSESKYLPEKLVGKVCLPGGQIEFGEEPDDSFIREVFEETGVTITPLLPFYTWTWIYKKDNIKKQIVAVARLGLYKNGEIKEPLHENEKETKLEKARWLLLKSIDVTTFVHDEQPVIKKFKEYIQKNPFL